MSLTLEQFDNAGVGEVSSMLAEIRATIVERDEARANLATRDEYLTGIIAGLDCDDGCGCGKHHCVLDEEAECVTCRLTRERDEWKRLALRDPMQLSDVTWRDCYEQLAEANQAHMRERDEARALVESLKAGNRKLHDQNTELMADVDQARAEVERLRSEAGRCDCDFCEAHGRSGHATRLLESLRERCAVTAGNMFVDDDDNVIGLAVLTSRIRRVPLEEP